jgi:hypothetical protein
LIRPRFKYKRPRLASYQKEILDSPARYTITEGTTKCGKTVSHVIWLYEEALKGRDRDNYWWVAPVFSQSKIAYTRLKRFIKNKDFFSSNESELSITLRTGAKIWFKSAEKPDNLYGEDVRAGVMDEFTRMREEAWFAIRSTLTATNGKAKFIGNVKGTGNWGYQLARKVESGKLDDWAYFKVTAADAVKEGILDQKEIEDAEQTLPKGVFLELYYGIPNENSSDKFCYSFNEEKHIGKCKVNYDYPVYLSFDFNYNPICVGVYQHYDNTIFCPEIIKLENSNIYSLCEVIKTKIPNALFIVTGDMSGKSHSALSKDNITYFKAIRQALNIPDSQMQIKGVNPRLEQNQVLVNAIFEHYTIQFDPDGAAPLIFDCKFVRMDNEKKIIKEDRNDPTQQADPLDTLRYYLNKFHSNFVKIPKH